MGKRLLVGIPLAVALVGLLLLDGYLAAEHEPGVPTSDSVRALGPWLRHGLICTLIVLVMTVLATHELVHLARARGCRPFGRTAQVFVAMLVVGPYVSFNWNAISGEPYDESWGLLWMALALVFVFLLQAVQHKTTNAMENIATTVFIVFYAGGLAGFMTKLRMEVGGSTGLALLIFSAFLVKMTDTGAYFNRRALGRTKMVPWLSPKKTWEGFIGGMIVTVVLAVAIGLWLQSTGVIAFRNPRLPYPVIMVLLGLMLGLVSAAGDLCASLLKRDAAVKDSGHAFPGLGGVLDVLDSPLLAAPFAWVFWTRLFPLAT